jgi:outer membrane receptor protein involved in Fe transport
VTVSFRRLAALILLLFAAPALAQPAASAAVRGRVTDETGGALPGVTVELRHAGAEPVIAVTGTDGHFAFTGLVAGTYQLTCTLVNFAGGTERTLYVSAGAVLQHNETMRLALNAEVVVVGRRTFTNLADLENPTENLVGIARSASQGAITGKQLEVRPFMRQGEVLETVPGVIITQHSGEGKANQYFLRGFNLDHGSDFAMTVAGAPVNMVTHAHSQGYADLNFLIPELVAGVQFSKGPYYAELGDFSVAGAANINYATHLDRPMAHVETGNYGFFRGLFAASPPVGGGHLLMAVETSTNDGPWTPADEFRKVNGVVRYTRGDNVNGLSLTGMAYHGAWHATQAVPQRAVEAGVVDRFGTVDPTDRGHSYRVSGGAEWQRSNGTTLNKIQGYGVAYDMMLLNNFTFFLDDPVAGDQHQQRDHRFLFGGRAFQKRLSRWGGRTVENTVGAQVRNDNVDVSLIHTTAGEALFTRTQAAAVVTTAGLYAENQIEWSPWLRTAAGLRADGSRYGVTDRLDARNSGIRYAGLLSPKATVIVKPWIGSEFYLNAGTGFHSNDARGTTIQYDTSGAPAQAVTPLVRATGTEVGFRTVAIPRLQTTVALWRLGLASELVYNGDLGATEPGPASRRYGIEISSYFRPEPWLIVDADISKSQARFAGADAGGGYVPEAVDLVMSGGVSIDNLRRMSASLRLRYFGPRALVEDNSVRSDATTLLNLEAGYTVTRQLRVNVEIYNLANARVSDIDYFFPSRLQGEPLEGVEDRHTHPAVPRTVRVGVIVRF